MQLFILSILPKSASILQHFTHIHPVSAPKIMHFNHLEHWIGKTSSSSALFLFAKYIFLPCANNPQLVWRAKWIRKRPCSTHDALSKAFIRGLSKTVRISKLLWGQARIRQSRSGDNIPCKKLLLISEPIDIEADLHRLWQFGQVFCGEAEQVNIAIHLHRLLQRILGTGDLRHPLVFALIKVGLCHAQYLVGITPPTFSRSQ